MKKLSAGIPFPKINFNRLDGAESMKVDASHPWQAVFVYRGAHCPRCMAYLDELNDALPLWYDAGIEVLVTSADPADRAIKTREARGWRFPLASDLSETDMAKLGLYISDPLPKPETDRPFAEPGFFLVRPDGNTHIIDISNSPVTRPDLSEALEGIRYVISTGRLPRGRRNAQPY